MSSLYIFKTYIFNLILKRFFIYARWNLRNSGDRMMTSATWPYQLTGYWVASVRDQLALTLRMTSPSRPAIRKKLIRYLLLFLRKHIDIVVLKVFVCRENCVWVWSINLREGLFHPVLNPDCSSALWTSLNKELGDLSAANNDYLCLLNPSKCKP